jgi:phosphopentomutase
VIPEQRAICLVLDGFGVGRMPDAELDADVSTARNVALNRGELRLPTLAALGLGNLAGIPGVPPCEAPSMSRWGRTAIRHGGADTYLGHQEMMGTVPPTPARQVLADIGERLATDLRERGFPAGILSIPDVGNVIVVGDMVVHDNIEAARGMNINVTASIDEVSFDEVVSLSRCVRELVDVTRVIAVGGRGFTRQDIIGHVRRHEQLHVGVDTPALGVYDENYLVRHLGIAVPTHMQAPSLAKASGLPVVLLGKAADVVTCEGADVCDPVIPTGDVFDAVEAALSEISEGLVVANVQETDLAGHEQDADRYADVLQQVDERLNAMLPTLRDQDLLVISADHGNDPTVGSSAHTREYVPILVTGTGVTPGPLGTRDTLADVGATLCQWLGCPATPDGTSLLDAPDPADAGDDGR